MNFRTTRFLVPMRTVPIATVLCASALAAFAQTAAAGEPPPAAVVERLSEVIRRHCPEALISVAEEKFVAKHGTMIFTVHNRSKTGEVFPETHQVEGPNYMGFILSVWRERGPYEGAAEMPQTLSELYFSTLIDAVSSDTAPINDGHLRVEFSYGSRIDEKLKQAILAALPKITSASGTDK